MSLIGNKKLLHEIINVRYGTNIKNVIYNLEILNLLKYQYLMNCINILLNIYICFDTFYI